MGWLKLRNEPKLAAKFAAFPYQQEAVDAIKDLDYAAVFHEQGLGKTKIAIDVLIHWLKSDLIDTVLILTKKGLINNWKEELESHTHFNPGILTNNDQANYYVFNGPFRVVLGNFEVVVKEKERIELFTEARRVGVILDESAKIKNPTARLTRTFLELRSHFLKRLILTGTPVANRPYDLWAQIFFLDGGTSLGDDFSNFKADLDLTNDLHDHPDKIFALESGLNGLFKKISKFAVRETKNSDIISLPDKHIANLLCESEKRQSEMYEEVRTELCLVVKQEGKLFEDQAENALKRILRLIQIASNPGLIDENYDQEPGKLPYLMDLLWRIYNNDEKVIVWTSFNDNIPLLKKALSQFGVTTVYGKMNIESRNENVKKFKKDPNIRVLIATPGAAKEGLTLTVANNAIFYDRTYSLDDYLQAQDRIHRISQEKPCYVYNLILKNTVDEWIDILLEAKRTAARVAQGDISIENYRERINYSYGIILKEILMTEGESTGECETA